MTGVPAEDIRATRPRVRDRAARGDLLHARHHRARVRRRQHLVALEPRAHDRPPRLRVDRAERAPRPEQRPGPERLGREPDVPPRLPARRRSRDPAEVLRGLGRRGAGDAGLPARPDDERAPRRPHHGALPHRREPGADRAERAPRRGGARQARLPDLAGHLPERHDPAKYADVVFPASSFAEKDGTFTNTERRVSRVRAAAPLPGRGARRPRDRPRAWRKALGVRLARVPGRGVGLERARRPRAELVRRPLRPARGERHAVARARDRRIPGRSSCTRRARAPAGRRASSSPSSTSGRSRSPTPSTRSSSRPAARSTTTTRRR